jgi:hypothetical protein
MANATITVLEADGVTQTDAIVLDVGRQAAAASKSVAASTEDKAVLDAIAASLALLDNSISAGNELQVDVVGALPAGTNNIGDVDVLTINGVAPAFNSGPVGATVQRVAIATDDIAIASVVTAINNAADPAVNVTPSSDSADGLTIFRSLDLDESEEEVKATAGNLYKLRLTNFATRVRYVKLYNATAANTTVGTTTPIDTIPVPAGSSTAPTVITESFGGLGLAFGTALCLAATTGLADNDTGAPAANDVVATAYYK